MLDDTLRIVNKPIFSASAFVQHVSSRFSSESRRTEYVHRGRRPHKSRHSSGAEEQQSINTARQAQDNGEQNLNLRVIGTGNVQQKGKAVRHFALRLLSFALCTLLIG